MTWAVLKKANPPSVGGRTNWRYEQFTATLIRSDFGPAACRLQHAGLSPGRGCAGPADLCADLLRGKPGPQPVQRRTDPVARPLMGYRQRPRHRCSVRHHAHLAWTSAPLGPVRDTASDSVGLDVVQPCGACDNLVSADLDCRHLSGRHHDNRALLCLGRGTDARLS